MNTNNTVDGGRPGSASWVQLKQLGSADEWWELFGQTKLCSQLLILHLKIFKDYPRNAAGTMIPTGGDQFANLCGCGSTTPTE